MGGPLEIRAAFWAGRPLFAGFMSEDCSHASLKCCCFGFIGFLLDFVSPLPRFPRETFPDGFALVKGKLLAYLSGICNVQDF